MECLLESDSYEWTDSDFERFCPDIVQEFSEDEFETYSEYERFRSPSPPPTPVKKKVLVKKKRKSGKPSARFDLSVHHPIAFESKKKRRIKCQAPTCRSFTHSYCKRCKVFLCYSMLRNCFAEYHGIRVPKVDNENVNNANQNGSSRKRRRSSDVVADEADVDVKKRYRESKPTDNVRFDGIGHFSIFDERAMRTTCKSDNCKQRTFSLCSKCRVHLCCNSNRNCFTEFHKKNEECEEQYLDFM
jgi:hypothetical protein